MSPAELLVECPTCHRTHAANAGCDHRDESPGCVVAAPVGPRVVDLGAAPSGPLGTVQYWHGMAAMWEARARQAHENAEQFARERDEARAARESRGVWRCCNCGDVVTAMDTRARWTGERFEHACGATPQAGAFDCRWFGPLPPDGPDGKPLIPPSVETYPCGCRGTPGNRCPVHSAP